MCARRWEEAWKISHCGHCTFHATCNKIFCCFIGALPLFLRGRDVCFAVCRMKMLNSYYIPTIHTDAKILHKRARLCPLKLPHCRQVCGLRSCAFQWIHAIDLLSRPQDFDRIFAGHPFVQWVAFAALLLCFVMQFLFRNSMEKHSSNTDRGWNIKRSLCGDIEEACRLLFIAFAVFASMFSARIQIHKCEVYIHL